MDVRTICHIFNFFGCGDIDWLIIEGKNKLDVIVVNKYRFDEPVNQAFLIFLESQIKTSELVKREQNEILRDLRAFIFFSLDIPLDFLFLRLKLFQASLGCASDNALLDSLHNIVDRGLNFL